MMGRGRRRRGGAETPVLCEGEVGCRLELLHFGFRLCLQSCPLGLLLLRSSPRVGGKRKWCELMNERSAY
jgi:hypothetical protein